jgi:hypothetical protein
LRVLKKEFFMKKFRVFSVILVCLLALGLVLVSCDDNTDPGESAPQTKTYTGTGDGTTYTLKITQNTNRAVYNPGSGDGYVLTIKKLEVTKTSSGIIVGVANGPISSSRFPTAALMM